MRTADSIGLGANHMRLLRVRNAFSVRVLRLQHPLIAAPVQMTRARPEIHNKLLRPRQAAAPAVCLRLKLMLMLIRLAARR